MGINKAWTKAGKTLAELRKSKGLSQGQLAKKLGIKSGPVFVSLLERGKAKMPPSLLKKIEKKFGPQIYLVQYSAEACFREYYEEVRGSSKPSSKRLKRFYGFMQALIHLPEPR